MCYCNEVSIKLANLTSTAFSSIGCQAHGECSYFHETKREVNHNRSDPPSWTYLRAASANVRLVTKALLSFPGLHQTFSIFTQPRFSRSHSTDTRSVPLSFTFIPMVLSCNRNLACLTTHLAEAKKNLILNHMYTEVFQYIQVWYILRF